MPAQAYPPASTRLARLLEGGLLRTLWLAMGLLLLIIQMITCHLASGRTCTQALEPIFRNAGFLQYSSGSLGGRRRLLGEGQQGRGRNVCADAVRSVAVAELELQKGGPSVLVT